MKFRPLWLALPACAIIASSCKKESAPAAKETPAEKPVASATPATPSAVAPVVPKVTTTALSADERAAKFGIVKHLPKDTEGFVTVYNGSKMASRFKKMKVWGLINEASDGALEDAAAPEKDADPAAPKPEGGPSGPGALLGQEVFLATGKGASGQAANLITLNNRMGYFQAKFFAKALVASSKGDSDKGLGETYSEMMGKQMFSELLKDPQSGIGLVEKAQMPPLYVGFKTAPETRDAVAQQVASVVEYMGMAEEMVEPVEFERAGTKFKGYRLLGEKLSKEMAKNRADIEEKLDAESVDRLIASVAKKNFVAVSGTLGDYVVLFLGSTVDDCQFVAEAKDSIASTDAIAFADPYAGKELAGLTYGSESMLKTLGTGNAGLSQMTSGLRDGLAGADGLGNTRDIEAMLQLVGERQADLQKLTSTDTMGLVSYFENGLKIETFGGIDTGAVDWKTPSRLGDLGASDDVVFFADYTADMNYDAKARAYAESLVETAYAVTKKFADAPVKDEEFKKFKDGFTLFDTKFRPDVLTLVDALHTDLKAGLGAESAMVVDMKGTVPPIPGIPQELADKGKFIRASWISPVTDRSKLASSWGKVNDATVKILKTVSEMAGSDFPMQKPTSSERNGFTTWFIQETFFSDDFMPSVTVSDKWFIASTSKNQALELGAAAEKPGKPATGFVMNVKVDPLRKFSLDWLKLVDANSAKVFADKPEKLEEFNTNKPKIEKGIQAMEDFESINASLRREDGRLRASIHFKTR